MTGHVGAQASGTDGYQISTRYVTLLMQDITALLIIHPCPLTISATVIVSASLCSL